MRYVLDADDNQSFDLNTHHNPSAVLLHVFDPQRSKLGGWSPLPTVFATPELESFDVDMTYGMLTLVQTTQSNTAVNVVTVFVRNDKFKRVLNS